MSTVTEVWNIPIHGMTCDHCVRKVSEALGRVPGVVSVSVDLAGARAEVTVDPSRADLETLRAAVEAAGYSVPEHERANEWARGRGSAPVTQPLTIGSTFHPEQGLDSSQQEPLAKAAANGREEWELSIGGMHFASCVARVEEPLDGVSGVQEARVNLATQRASVTVDPGRADLDQLISSVAKAGYWPK